MPERKPVKPSQFTESFQFIQSLFQEKESKRAKAFRFLQRFFQLIKWVVSLLLITGLASLIAIYEIEAIAFTDQGIWIPRR